MKMTFALGLLLSAAVAQASGYPWVRNNGNSVTLDYWNSTDRDERCNGTIYLDMEDGTRDSIHVYEFVWRRGSLYRTYRPMNSSGRIMHTQSSVYCW